DDPGAGPGPAANDALATPACLCGTTETRGRVRVDLQSLLHPWCLRHPGSASSPARTRIRPAGGGPELHCLCDPVIAVALSCGDPRRPFRSVDPGGNRPCGCRHRDGQYSARPRPVDAPRPDGPFRCRSRFRVPRGVDARFSRRRPGSARRRDGLVLRRPRFRGRGAPVMAAVASVTTFGGGIWASAWVSLIGLAFLARVLISTETPLVVGSTRLMNGPK